MPREHLNTISMYSFYAFVFLGVILVFFSFPFVRLPYDAIAHLIAIDEQYHDVLVNSTSIPEDRLIWHKLWAFLFQVFRIESLEFLLRTKIIHVTQTLIALFSVYYFSHVVIRNLFKNISVLMVKYLSLWSVIIWITLFANFSMYYHEVWLMWYSINYQITLPLFFYLSGITLVLVLEKSTKSLTIVFIVQTLILMWFILQVHSMEFLYYLLYMLVFSLIYFSSVYKFIYKYPYIAGLITLLSIGFIYFFNHDVPKFNRYFMHALDGNDPNYLYKKILATGENVVSYYNRSTNIINELMYMIVYMGIVALIFFLWKNYRNKDIINHKILIFLIVTSLFVLIPLYVFPAGLFGLITRDTVAYRFYYSASTFVLLPVFVYYILHSFTVKLRYVNIVLVVLLVSVFYYSKSSNLLSHNYYKNIMSIKSSFDSEKIRFNFSQQQIEDIGKVVEYYEEQNKTDKEILYFARYDIAFVLKYVYGKKIWWKGRRENYSYNIEYWDHYQYQSKIYHPVLFKTLGSFPKYVPFR